MVKKKNKLMMMVFMLNNLFKNSNYNYYIGNGFEKMHERFIREAPGVKQMDPVPFKQVLEETTILAEEEFRELQTSKYSSFFYPKFDKSYYFFMFSLSVMSGLTLFKERLSPCLTVYKGNFYSLISITLRISGVMFFLVPLFLSYIGHYKSYKIFAFIIRVIGYIYDQEAIGNIAAYAIDVAIFGSFFILAFHIVYGYMHYFPFKLSANPVYLFRNLFLIYIFGSFIYFFCHIWHLYWEYLYMLLDNYGMFIIPFYISKIMFMPFVPYKVLPELDWNVIFLRNTDTFLYLQSEIDLPLWNNYIEEICSYYIIL